MTEVERISQLLRDPAMHDRLRREVAQRALREHRAAGVPLVSTRDGEVVLLDPHTLDQLPPDEAAKWLRAQNEG